MNRRYSAALQEEFVQKKNNLPASQVSPYTREARD